jgi:Putative prokaryotic signal transducing protein
MPLVIIARYTSPWNAHIDRALLDSEGIKAYLIDEHIVGANWLNSLAFGNVKLAVPESQRANAEAILAELKSGALEAALGAEFGFARLACPACDSTDLQPCPSAPDRAIQILNFALLGFFHPPPWGRFSCYTCHNKFEVGE